MKPLLLLRCCCIILLFGCLAAFGADKRVLIYTKNGKGYVHDNIAASVAAIQELGRQNGFTAEASTNPAVFVDTNLSRFDAVIFSNSNNEAFDTEEQRAAFQRFIRRGGGFVGIHSASGSERTWPYFWAVLGGKFTRHAPLQKFTVRIVDGRHPATKHLGQSWECTDECYYLDHLNPDIHVLLAADLNTIKDAQKEKYPGKVFGDAFPLSWCHEFDGGRQFYTALGHKIEHYADPAFRRHLLGGIQWAMKAGGE